MPGQDKALEDGKGAGQLFSLLSFAFGEEHREKNLEGCDSGGRTNTQHLFAFARS